MQEVINEKQIGGTCGLDSGRRCRSFRTRASSQRRGTFRDSSRDQRHCGFQSESIIVSVVEDIQRHSQKGSTIQTLILPQVYVRTTVQSRYEFSIAY